MSEEVCQESKKMQAEIAEEFFLKVKEKLHEVLEEKECKILDIGSGDGKILSQVLLKKSDLKISRFIGTDKDEELIKSSNENFGSEIVAFHVFDAEEEIPEAIAAAGPFDLITSFSSLHQVKNLEKVIENVNALLSSDGVFYFVMPTVVSISESIAEIAENFQDHKEKIIEGVAALVKDEKFSEELQKMLNDNGLTVEIYESVSIEKEKKELRGKKLKNIQDIFNFLRIFDF
jgi:2-polyprenyl-3-methyl-5-hydroxy-6-metoxy-1,4-benzoquinol methylase